MRSERQKTAFLGTIRRVIDVCATVLYGISRLFTAAFTLTACPYTCTHAFWLLLACLTAATFSP